MQRNLAFQMPPRPPSPTPGAEGLDVHHLLLQLQLDHTKIIIVRKNQQSHLYYTTRHYRHRQQQHRRHHHRRLQQQQHYRQC